jgi:hypothetical protein
VYCVLQVGDRVLRVGVASGVAGGVVVEMSMSVVGDAGGTVDAAMPMVLWVRELRVCDIQY